MSNVDELRKRVTELEAEVEEYESLLKVQRKRMAGAVERWRLATGERLSSPDLGNLLRWLMDEADRLKDEKNSYWAEVQYLRTAIKGEKSTEPLAVEHNTTLEREGASRAYDKVVDVLTDMQDYMRDLLHVVDEGFTLGKENH